MSDTDAASMAYSFTGNGLSYVITVTRAEDGSFSASLTVTEGHADINAIYWGDDDMTGRSTSLGGPLNMNGGGSTHDGQAVQWDGALKLSDPGLGRAGADKATYLQAGDTLTFDLPIDSLDDVAFIGIRATSTSTPEGSIKAVTPGTEVPDDDDCEDDCAGECDTPARDDYPDLPADTTGVTFGVDILGEGKINEFVYVTAEETGVEGVPTFADYVATLDARLEALDDPCEAEPLKAIIYGPDGSETYYNFVDGPLEIDLLPKETADAQDDLLPSVPVEDEDATYVDEDEEDLELV